jgi:hypothetical protein
MRFHPPAPSELLGRSQHAGERSDLELERVRWRLVRPVSEKSASDGVPDKDEGHPEP